MSVWAQKIFGAAILSVASLTAGNVVAQGKGDILASAKLCLVQTNDIDTIAEALRAEGWRKLDPVPNEAIRSLAWTSVVYYFNGDSGGEQLRTIYDLQLGTARGLARKKDIATSKSRFLSRGEDTAIVIWRKPTEKITEVDCRFAAGSDATRDVRQTASDLVPDASGFDALAPISPLQDGTANQITIVLLDRDILSRQIGEPVTVDAIVQTNLIFRAQE
jgi:hypothetical protein